jgi:hypothetical protein
MSEFYPISPLVGITNTSYSAQAGVMNEMWACRVVRGKKVIVEKTISELDLDNYVGVIYGHIRVEGISRHAVAMCAGRLMQFARKYQASGISPNFDVPDLVYDDGRVTDSSGEDASGSGGSAPADVAAVQPTLKAAPVGRLPDLMPVACRAQWESTIQSYGVLACEAAIYGASLPEGHLELMFSRAADELIGLWIDPEDPEAVLLRFAEMIYSCSADSQLPKTGMQSVTVETQGCGLLTAARQVDPEGTKLSFGYPCRFHEIVAEKVAAITGLKISVNTSSTGCIITMAFE